VNIVTVTDIYGRKCRISRDDFDGPRIQLRLYNKQGKRYEYRAGIRECISIRDNIAIIDGKEIKPLLPPLPAHLQ
jgi:hypothetical protein